MKRFSFILLATLLTISCKKDQQQTKGDQSIAVTTEVKKIEKTQKKDHQLNEVKKAVIVPEIDGKMDDPAWQKIKWLPMDQAWIGEYPTVDDFFGRYKVTWTPEALYVLVEVKDDILIDQYKDPMTQWWDDDCVEIFIDSDNSGGEHQFNNNAFAYHIALDGNVLDLDSKKEPILYNNHMVSKRITNGNVSVWEFSINLYDDTYEEGKTNDALILQKDQKIGFAIAYNDNDTSKERENFMGSVFVPGEDKNQGWINADVFGTILLKE